MRAALRSDVDSQRVLRLSRVRCVVHIGRLAEDQGPDAWPGNRPQTVLACREILIVQLHVTCECNCGRLVSAGVPHFVEGDELTEQLTSTRDRAAVGDRDFRVGDALGHRSRLALRHFVQGQDFGGRARPRVAAERVPHRHDVTPWIALATGYDQERADE